MKKGRERGERRKKKKRVIKHTLKYLYEFKIPQKIHKKTGKNFRGRGRIFLAGQNIYPCISIKCSDRSLVVVVEVMTDQPADRLTIQLTDGHED